MSVAHKQTHVGERVQKKSLQSSYKKQDHIVGEGIRTQLLVRAFHLVEKKESR